jgi:hypothetical protein
VDLLPNSFVPFMTHILAFISLGFVVYVKLGFDVYVKLVVV